MVTKELTRIFAGVQPGHWGSVGHGLGILGAGLVLVSQMNAHLRGQIQQIPVWLGRLRPPDIPVRLRQPRVRGGPRVGGGPRVAGDPFVGGMLGLLGWCGRTRPPSLGPLG